MNDDYTIQVIEAITGLTDLPILDLQHNCIRDRGCHRIVVLVKILRLRILFIQDGNKMSLITLRELLQLTFYIEYSYSEAFLHNGQKYMRIGIFYLEYLCLSQMNIGDEGAILLAESLWMMPNMIMLFFYENGVSEKGASAFLPNLHMMPILTYLSLARNLIPQAYVEIFEKEYKSKFPNLEVGLGGQLLHEERDGIFSPTAPDYRRVYDGLSFRSHCIHEGCVAYEDVIIVNMRLGNFDMSEAAASLKCPACGNQAGPPFSYGFLSAQWKFSDIIDGEMEVNIPSGRTHKYIFWMANEINWRFRKVQVDAYRL